MTCAECGEPVSLPYFCRRCQKQYCPKHRLPESHHCVGIHEQRTGKLGVMSRNESPVVTTADDAQKASLRRDAGGVEYHTEYTYSYEPTLSKGHRQKGKRVHFSRTEVLHLLAASALLLLLSYSVVSPLFLPIQLDLTSFLFYTLVLFLAFIPHELMHKVIAQRYGLFAEFRIVPYYALLTLLFILLPYKLFAPGAVMIGGAASPREYGKTAAAGPATNVALGGSLLGLAFVLPSYAPFLLFGAWFSGWLSFFNMLPVFPFDGEKVIHWSRAAFAVLISASIALFLLPLYLLM